MLATAGADDAARVWDPASGQEIETLGVRRTRRVAWGEFNGRPALAAGGDGAAVVVFNPDRLQHFLNGHNITVHDVQWATLGGQPVIATAAGDHTARVWDPVNGRELVTITGHTGAVYSAAWGELDGKPVLATTSQDGTIRISELRIEQFTGLLPRYESDEIKLSGTADPLGRDPEAAALAELVCARSALPPLAVGIFGDWGEGKSYFMKQVSRHVDRLARAVRDSERGGHEDRLTYGEVRQVWFSAWHYAETDLWASLVAVLFEELATGAGNAETAQRQGSRLASEIITQRAVRERLAAAEARRNELGEWLHAGLAVTAWRDFRRRWPQVVFGFVLLAVAIAAGFWALRSSATWNALQAIASLILAAAAFAGAVTAALRPLGDVWQATVGLRHSAAKMVNEARRWDDSRRLKLQTAFDVAEAEVSALREELRDLTAAGQLAGLVRQRADAGDYRSQLGLMSRIRHDFTQMAELLERERQQRQSSAVGAYKSEDDDVGDQLPAIDRIVLYIDDLDRCPPDRVVAVLEAVHLLLAVPLFVVVVAVDPRWLLKSLSVHYRDMLDPLNKEGPHHIAGDLTHPTAAGSEPEDKDDLWSSTPMNYLEKIFQVPFTLQPVSRAGYKQLVVSLTGDPLQSARERESGSRELGGGSPEGVPADASSLRQLSDRHAKAREPGLAGGTIRRWVNVYRNSREARLPQPKSEGAEPEPDFPQTPAYVPKLPAPPSDGRANPLALTADERRLLKILGPGLVTSPRSVKRLVNSYGLLNALRGRQRAQDLMPYQDPRTGQSWHPYRAALVLLATLIGFPTESPALFETLYRRARSLPATTWAEFVDELEPQSTGDEHG